MTKGNENANNNWHSSTDAADGLPAMGCKSGSVFFTDGTEDFSTRGILSTSFNDHVTYRKEGLK